jgi:hypothetical protein
MICFTVVDPEIRMSWMNEKWDTTRVSDARCYIINLVCLFDW